MEMICQRFPLVAKKILNDVDDKSLVNFKVASKLNVNFLEEERFYWVRVIKRYNCLYEELRDVWKVVMRQTPVGIIKDLAIAIHGFPIIMKRRYQHVALSPLAFVQKIGRQWHPLFVSATSGSFRLRNHIIERTGIMQPDLYLTIIDQKLSLEIEMEYF